MLRLESSGGDGKTEGGEVLEGGAFGVEEWLDGVVSWEGWRRSFEDVFDLRVSEILDRYR